MRLLDHMLALCETVTCRRQFLLSYFGEMDSPDSCGNCDVCLHPPKLWQASVQAQMLLSTVIRTQKERGRKFAAGQHIDVLRGVTSERVSDLRLDELTTWGIGKEWSEAKWRQVTRHLVALGYLRAEGEWGVLWPTEKARPVLSGDEQVYVREDTLEPRAKAKKVTAASELSSEAQEIFERLRDWRQAEAKSQGVPGYVVFADTTLAALAEHKPQNDDELLTISGIGQVKLERYGADVLQLIAS